MTSDSPGIFLQYSSLLSCKGFLPHPTFYCSLLNSADPFPSFWSILHPRCHCSLFLSCCLRIWLIIFCDCSFASKPHLMLSLSTRKRVLEEIGLSSKPWRQQKKRWVKVIHPLLSHFFFWMTWDGLSWARTAAQNRTCLTLRGAASCSRLFSWGDACHAFPNASSAVAGAHAFSLPCAVLKLAPLCLKPLRSSTHLNCPITQTARTKELMRVWEGLAGAKPAVRDFSALTPNHWWLRCVHVSRRLAALFHYPFLCFSEKRILTFASFKDQAGHMLDVGVPVPPRHV